jgi:hypothetical protein
MFANAASVLIQAAMRFLRFGASLAASSFTGRGSCLNRLSPVWVLQPSRFVCHTLWNSGKSVKQSPWPALTSTSSVVCFQGVPLVKNLTGRSTWTPTAAMPSAFYWPLLVPCAPAGLRRQLTNSLGPRVNAPRAQAKRATSSVATRSQACASWFAQGLVACLHSSWLQHSNQHTGVSCQVSRTPPPA